MLAMSILVPMLLVGLLGLGFVLLAFRSSAAVDASQPSRAATGRALYQQRLQELDAELAGGLLNEASHAEAVNELGLALLEDQDGGAGERAALAGSSSRGWLLAFALENLALSK